MLQELNENKTVLACDESMLLLSMFNLKMTVNGLAGGSVHRI